MAEGKWIAGIAPDMPLLDAARLVLPARFAAVLQHVPNAVRLAARDPEYIHQLRVATRRATAALRLFADCLHRQNRSSLKARLRSIRRAAGAARDCDVFSQMLATSPILQPASAKTARDFLAGMQAARRFDAQALLTEIADEDGAKLAKEIERLDDPSAWRDGKSPTAGAMAAEQIAGLIDAFGQAATPVPAACEDLHRLRILGKRLRYSIEVFAECFEASLRERLYPAIEEIQETLGAITDAHVAAQRLIEIRDHVKAFQRTAWPRYRQTIERLLQSQRRVLPRERKRFQTWLTNWRRLSKESPIRLVK